MSYYAIRRALREVEVNVNLAEVEKVKLADASNNVINPATEDTLSALKGTVDNIYARDWVKIKDSTSEQYLKIENGRAHVMMQGRKLLLYSASEGAPAASSQYDFGPWSMEPGTACIIAVYADLQVGVQVLATFRTPDGDFEAPLAGAEIAEADFVAGAWNHIVVHAPLYRIKVRVKTGSTAPSVIYVCARAIV